MRHFIIQTKKLIKNKMQHKTYIKLIISLFAAIFLSFNTLIFSQEFPDPQLNWMHGLKVNQTQLPDIIHIDENVLIYRSKQINNYHINNSIIDSEKVILYRVDRKTNERTQYEIELKTADQRRNLEKMFYMDNEIHVISSFINQKQKKYYFFHETINPDNLILQDNARKIFEIDFSEFAKIKVSSIQSEVKIEQNKFVIHSGFRTKNEFQNYFNVIDLNMKEVANYHVTTQWNSNYVAAFTIDSLSNLYYLDRKQIDKKSMHKHTIVFYWKEQKTPITRELDIKYFSGDMKMGINHKNQLVCAGLFSNAYTTPAVGAYTIVIPEGLTGKEIINYQRFSDNFINSENHKISAFMFGALASRSANALNYQIDDLIFNKDGSFSFSSEKLIIMVQAQKNERTYFYHFTDVFVMTCDEDGTVRWHDNIFKKQVFSKYTILVGSYIRYIDDNGKLNFIYCDSKGGKNIFSKSIPDASETMLVQFDQYGKREDKVLFTDNNIVSGILPGCTKYFGNNKVALVKMNVQLLKYDFSIVDIEIK